MPEFQVTQRLSDLATSDPFHHQSPPSHVVVPISPVSLGLCCVKIINVGLIFLLEYLRLGLQLSPHLQVRIIQDGAMHQHGVNLITLKIPTVSVYSRFIVEIFIHSPFVRKLHKTKKKITYLCLSCC